MAAGTPGSKRSLNMAALEVASDGSLLYSGDTATPTRIINAPPTTLWASSPASHDKEQDRAFLFLDDFMQQASATVSAYATYTDMNDGATGTNAFQDASGGIFNIVTAAALDDYHGIRTTAKPWLFAATKELWFEAKFKVAEAAANASSWFIGLSDTFTTGGLQTGASGPLASFSGAGWFKVQSSMAAKFITSNAGTQSISGTLATVVTNQAIKVGFYFDGTATTGNLFPFIDIGDGNGYTACAVQTITLASLAQMALFATIKAGGANAETLQLDYIKCYALR